MANRRHQQEISRIADQVIAGTWSKPHATLDVTPGGGKTGAGTLLANRLLDAGVVDSVLWLVPRLSLADQVLDAFAAGVGSREGRRLTVVEDQDDLFPAQLPNMPLVVGHVTTYQQVATGTGSRRFRDASLARRTLLILDEVQFLSDGQGDGNGWWPRVKGVVEAARFRLNMSGTLARTDNGLVAGVEYVQGDGSERYPDAGKKYPVADVRYTLRDAIAERAILPTEWRNRGGLVEYRYEGIRQLHDLADDADDEESRKVRTYLESDRVVAGVVEEMIRDWRQWREETRYYSRMIIMAEDQKRARWFDRYMKENHPDVACVLAITDEDHATRKVRQFREGVQGQCLITVAMAYVGFDCPNLTHMAYLSHYRAPAWLLQSFARVSRFDSKAPIPYDLQHAFVFTVDDARMRAFFEYLRSEQEMGVRARRPGRGPRKSDAGAPAEPDDFEPIDAAAGALAVETMAERIDPETAAKVEAFRRTCGPYAANLPAVNLLNILRRAKDAGGVV